MYVYVCMYMYKHMYTQVSTQVCTLRGAVNLEPPRPAPEKGPARSSFGSAAAARDGNPAPI